MRTVKLYLPLTLLVLGSLVLAIKTVQIYKDKQIILSQIQVKDSVDGNVGKEMTDTDLITARQMIEGYAALYSLPVEVKLVKRDIRVTVLAPKQEEGEIVATVGEREKLAVLQNFNNVMGFFTSLSNMPYSLDYKEFCVGIDCPNVFDVTIAAKNHQVEESQPAANGKSSGKSAGGAPVQGAPST